MFFDYFHVMWMIISGKETTGACSANNTDCVNTIGSYTCQCKEYYEGNPLIGCDDIDECSAPNDCKPIVNGGATCVNTEPLYRCDRTCDRGFILLDPSLTNIAGVYSCGDEDECSSPNRCPGSNVACINTVGKFGGLLRYQSHFTHPRI